MTGSFYRPIRTIRTTRYTVFHISIHCVARFLRCLSKTLKNENSEYDFSDDSDDEPPPKRRKTSTNLVWVEVQMDTGRLLRSSKN